MSELALPPRPGQPPQPERTGSSLPSSPGKRNQPWLLQTLFRTVPALDALRTYSWGALRADLFAGMTVAAVAVPQAMAYSLIIGLPVEFGLYTAIVMTAVGALLDSSRQLINGPTNAISIAVLSALAGIPELAQQDRVAAAVLLALLVGLAQTGITLLRLGDLSRYISHAVVIGFTLGAGMLLVLDQLKNLLGLPSPPATEVEHYFLLRFWQTCTYGTIHPWTAVLGMGTIVCLLGLRWLKRLPLPGIHTLPEFLVTLIAGAFLVWALNLSEHGVAVVGTIPAKLPEFGLPQLEWSWVRQLATSAVCIALLGLLEAIAMAKAIAAQTGQKLDINQQCLSEGLANLAGSFFSCFPGSGSLTRSTINQQAGAVSQWSGVIAAAAVAATVLLFAPMAYYIPRATLAGILMVSVGRMIDGKQLLFHVRATRFDLGLVAATAVAAVAISVEFCILIGVFLSFVLYVPRAARLHFSEVVVTPEGILRDRTPANQPCSRLLIFNLEGELFFGSAPELDRHLTTVESRLEPTPEPPNASATSANEPKEARVRVVVLRVKHARNPDAVCLAALDSFVRRLEERQVALLLCGVRPELVPALSNTGLAGYLGDRLFLETVDESSTLEAVRRAYDLLQDDLCPHCPRAARRSERNERSERNGKEAWYYMI